MGRRKSKPVEEARAKPAICVPLTFFSNAFLASRFRRNERARTCEKPHRPSPRGPLRHVRDSPSILLYPPTPFMQIVMTASGTESHELYLTMGGAYFRTWIISDYPFPFSVPARIYPYELKMTTSDRFIFPTTKTARRNADQGKDTYRPI